MSRINLYAIIKPYDFNLALSFYTNETIGDIHFFIEETMKKMRMRYKVGRIETKQNMAWLLPQYEIGTFLSQGDELIVYSVEYGITLRELAKSDMKEDIDTLFIGKKLKRKREEDEEDGRVSLFKSRPMSHTAIIKHNLKQKTDKVISDKEISKKQEEESEPEHEEENEEENNEDDNKSKSNSDNDDESEKRHKKKRKVSESNEKDDDDDDVDSKSGSDKDDDIALTSNKKKK